MHSRSTQPTLALRERFGHGGRRPGAGRKPQGTRAGVSHRARPVLTGRHPLHVTLRVLPHVPNLRTRHVFACVEAALALALRRDDFRVVQFSVLGNHLHLLVEADSSAALARGMAGFSTSLAKRINALAGRHGRVFADRYHVRVLRTPAQVRAALAYVLLNHRSHEARAGVWLGQGSFDRCSSAACFDGWRDAPRVPEPARRTARPRSWLLANGWRRCGLLSLSEVPAVHEGHRRRAVHGPS